MPSQGTLGCNAFFCLFTLRKEMNEEERKIDGHVGQMSIDPPYYWGPPDPRAVVDPEIGQAVDLIPPALEPFLPSYEDDSKSDIVLESSTRSVSSNAVSFSASSSSSSASVRGALTQFPSYDEWIGVAGDSPSSNRQGASHESKHPAGLYDESWAPSAFLAARVRALQALLFATPAFCSTVDRFFFSPLPLFFSPPPILFFFARSLPILRFLHCCGATDPCLKWWISPSTPKRRMPTGPRPYSAPRWGSTKLRQGSQQYSALL